MRIFNRYFSVYDLILLLGDVILAFLAPAVVRAALSFTDSPISPLSIHWTMQSVAIGIIVVLAFYYCDLYAIDQTLSVRELILRLFTAIGFSCVVIGIVSYPIPQLGKTIYASEILLIAVGLCLWRIGFLEVVRKARIHGRVLIVGVQAIGKLVAEELLRQRKSGMEVVGFVSNAPGICTLSYGNPVKISLPVFGQSSLRNLLQEKKVNRILLSSAETGNGTFGRELLLLRTEGVQIEDCHTFFERLASKIAIVDLSPEWFVRAGGFRRGLLVMFTKRIIDIIASALGMLCSAPIIMLATVAIKLESPGPLLYRQERVGQGGRLFTIYKFRSMTENAEANVGPVWATQDDPRVTRVGKLIRKLRIDEIPQMVNVLKGEMSFVGPRPERPFFVQGLTAKIPFYDLRHSVKPGITGWAQICYPYGDSEEDAKEKLQYELYYIKHMSALFDLQIIFESLKVILLGRGAR
jgi:sugar transferase (PEP-CTERM system associated)